MPRRPTFIGSGVRNDQYRGCLADDTVREFAALKADDERHAELLAELRRQRRRRTKITIATACVLFVFVFVPACVWCTGFGRGHLAVERPGAVQIIADDKEVWVFLEIDLSVRQQGAIAGAPRTSLISQVALRFDEQGVNAVVPIPAGKQITFNQNLSHIFGRDDGLYLFDPPSRMTKWAGDHFSPIAFDRQTFPPLPELSNTPVYQEAELLDRTSSRHGWSPIVREYDSFTAAPFEWKGCRFTLEPDETTNPATIRLRRVDVDQGWSATAATYDATPRRARRGE